MREGFKNFPQNLTISLPGIGLSFRQLIKLSVRLQIKSIIRLLIKPPIRPLIRLPIILIIIPTFILLFRPLICPEFKLVISPSVRVYIRPPMPSPVCYTPFYKDKSLLFDKGYDLMPFSLSANYPITPPQYLF